MTDTFTWTVDVGISGKSDFRVRTAQFGDGYSQSVADGLNNKVQAWNIVISDIYASEMAPITAFLDAHQGATSFYWTPPDGVQGYYTCVTYTETPAAANLRSLSATFQQVFHP